MEALCFEYSLTPLFGTTPCHSMFQKTKTLTINKAEKSLKNQLSNITATLTNQKVEIFHRASHLNSHKKTKLPKPSHIPQLMRVPSESLVYESGFLGVVPKKLAGESHNHNHNHKDINYLNEILLSKVYDVAVETPLEYASKLSEKLDVHIWLKREDLQPGVSTSLVLLLFNERYFGVFFFCLFIYYFLKIPLVMVLVHTKVKSFEVYYHLSHLLMFPRDICKV